MSYSEQTESSEVEDNGFVDALSAVLLIVIAVSTVVYWLSGM